MIKDRQSIIIEATPEVVWRTISDFENSYVFEHENVRILSDNKTLRNGLRFTEKEKIGGILASVEAEVFDVVPNSKYSFKGDAKYHFMGLKIPVKQGGTFEIHAREDHSELTMEVWGQFQNNLLGKLAEFFSKQFLNIEAAVAKHDAGELQDFKRVIENSDHSLKNK